MTIIVTRNTASCSRPTCKACLNSLTCARRVPVKISIPARAASGIFIRIPGISATASRRNAPCAKLAQPVFAPLSMLDFERTTSLIIGTPPMMDTITLPIPAASRSLFKSDDLRSGSSESTAETVSSDSIDPTMVNITMYLILVTLMIWLKSGSVIAVRMLLGSFTKNFAGSRICVAPLNT